MKADRVSRSLSSGTAGPVTKLLPLMIAIFVAACSSLAGCTPQPPPPPADAKAICTVSASEFASWFESGAVSLDGAVTPANSVTFPDSPNCSFYQWSERMFLWLTSPAPPRYGGGGGRVFDSPAFYDVSPIDANLERTFLAHGSGIPRIFTLRAAQLGRHGLPILFDRSGRMLEILNPVIARSGKQRVLDESGDTLEIERATIGRDRRPAFFDPTGKPIRGPRPIIPRDLRDTLVVQKFIFEGHPLFLDLFGNVINVDQGQAGGGEVLLAQNGSLVYYISIVNNVFAYFLTGAKTGGITPTPTQFPTTQAELDKIATFASAHGRTLVDPEALVIEVKSSWIEIASLSNADEFITVQATIPTYDRSNPDQWIPNGQKTAQLALVGMHVVGSAAGHPEMIWATFEHIRNTPAASYTYVNTSNQTTTVPQNTNADWLFCATNAAGPFNQAHARMDGDRIVSVPPFHIDPSNTIRWKAWGGASDASPNPIATPTAASNTEIVAINNSIRGMLVSGDARRNYIMTGATWTIGGASPTGCFRGAGGGGNEVGTSKLENTTMETYQQGNSSLWVNRSSANCFSCHGSNTTSVSHMFGPLKPLF